MKRKPIRFKGWDWTELLQLKQVAGRKWPKLPEKLETETHMTQEDAEAAYLIKEYLGSFFCDDSRSKERERVAKYVRSFCKALSKCKHDYSTPVYAGMAQIEHDEVLFRWVCNNLECMWT